MIKNLIIGESGGTKTDWCLISGSKKEFLTTESYHPRNINEQFIERAKQFWSKKTDLTQFKVHFYGAGCFHEEGKNKIGSVLNEIGFQSVSVDSDVLGASIALGLNNNWGAISGTGSVVFKGDSKSISELRGGKGRVMGDEGSGFYFGKLLVEALINNQIDQSIKTAIEKIVCHSEISDFSKLTSDFNSNSSIRRLHYQNISLLADNYLNEIDNIRFCGSYAFHHQELFKEVLKGYGINVTSFNEKPIVSIVDFHLLE